MTKQAKQILFHTIEAVVVFMLAAGVAYAFPEHATTAGVLAFTTLSSFAKYARVSDDVPVPDFVNGKAE